MTPKNSRVLPLFLFIVISLCVLEVHNEECSSGMRKTFITSSNTYGYGISRRTTPLYLTYSLEAQVPYGSTVGSLPTLVSKFILRSQPQHKAHLKNQMGSPLLFQRVNSKSEAGTLTQDIVDSQIYMYQKLTFIKTLGILVPIQCHCHKCTGSI